MEDFLALSKYEVSAAFREGVVEWSLHLQTEDGRKHAVRVRDGEELPILIDILRRDATVYFSPSTSTLRTGLSALGS